MHRQPHSEQTKEKIRQAHLGKKLSSEHRAKVIKTLHFGLKGANNPGWKGGRIITKEGYVKVLTPSGYIYEHRVVMGKFLRRELTVDEIIHHKNNNKQDNRIENLQLTTQSEHSNKFTWDKANRLKQSKRMEEVRKNKFWSTRKKPIQS